MAMADLIWANITSCMKESIHYGVQENVLVIKQTIKDKEANLVHLTTKQEEFQRRVKAC